MFIRVLTIKVCIIHKHSQCHLLHNVWEILEVFFFKIHSDIYYLYNLSTVVSHSQALRNINKIEKNGFHMNSEKGILVGYLLFSLSKSE